MLVSIITVYYNREKFVFPALKSLLKQSYTNIEIIVIDDGSTDLTYEKMLEFENVYKDPRLYIKTQTNKGFVQTMIEAVNLCRGDIIAIHGSGDLSAPNRIEEQTSLLKKNPEVGVVGSYVMNKNLTTRRYSFFKKKFPSYGKKLTKVLLDKNIFTHGEVMFRKEVYNKVGGYRSFFKYAQDRDLWLRMSEFTSFDVVPKYLYTRYTLEGGVNASLEKKAMQKYFNEISRQNIYRKRAGKQDLIDRYGMYAPFFMKKSSHLSHQLFRLSVRAFLNKNIILSESLIEQALRNNNYSPNIAILAYLIKLVKRAPYLQKPISLLINKLLK